MTLELSPSKSLPLCKRLVLRREGQATRNRRRKRPAPGDMGARGDLPHCPPVPEALQAPAGVGCPAFRLPRIEPAPWAGRQLASTDPPHSTHSTCTHTNPRNTRHTRAIYTCTVHTHVHATCFSVLVYTLVFPSSMEDLEVGDRWQRLEECQGKEASSQVLDWVGGPAGAGRTGDSSWKLSGCWLLSPREKALQLGGWAASY